MLLLQTGTASYSLDMTPALGYSIVLHMQGLDGPSPLSWQSVIDDCSPIVGHFLYGPGVPFEMLLSYDGHSLAQQIPADVVSLGNLAPFIRHAIYQACVRFSQARELGADCPLLLIMVLASARQKGLEPQQLNKLLRCKRAQLLDFCGLPESPSLARLLRRITMTPVTGWQLDVVYRVLGSEDNLRLLRHHAAPELNHLWLLDLVESPWPGLLNMIETGATFYDVVSLRHLIEDSRRLAPNGSRLYHQSSRQAVQQLHDELIKSFNDVSASGRAAELAWRYGDYPAAPLGSSDTIVALESWLSLVQEGQRMHHCVGGYGKSVASGNVFIYHMHAPQHLTISLEPSGERWRLREAKGFCNTSPNEAALEAIQRWLESRK